MEGENIGPPTVSTIPIHLLLTRLLKRTYIGLQEILEQYEKFKKIKIIFINFFLFVEYQDVMMKIKRNY